MIYDTLGVTIPESYRRIAECCANYGAYLNGIGEDYDHGVHIIRLNQVFHGLTDTAALPAHYVLLSHGQDGECDCWDLREWTQSGEHLIVHIGLEEGCDDVPSRVRVDDARYDCFEHYLKATALYYAAHLSCPRALELVEEIECEND